MAKQERCSVHSMNRKDLEMELTELGAIFSSRQLVPELRTLLTQTRAELGLEGPKKGGGKKGLIPSLSSLNKAQLFKRAADAGLTAEPTWTAGKLMTEIRWAEMLELTPSGNDKMVFGKHQGESFWHVRHSDSGYCEWLLQQPRSTNPDFEYFRRYLLGEPGEDPQRFILEHRLSPEAAAKLTKVKLESDSAAEVAQMKKELMEMKEELRAAKQEKRGASGSADTPQAMPVEPAISTSDLQELIGFVRGLGHRMEQLETQKPAQK